MADGGDVEALVKRNTKEHGVEMKDARTTFFVLSQPGVSLQFEAHDLDRNLSGRFFPSTERPMTRDSSFCSMNEILSPYDEVAYGYLPLRLMNMYPTLTQSDTFNWLTGNIKEATAKAYTKGVTFEFERSRFLADAMDARSELEIQISIVETLSDGSSRVCCVQCLYFFQLL